MIMMIMIMMMMMMMIYERRVGNVGEL